MTIHKKNTPIVCSNRFLIDGYQLILNNRAWCPVGETTPRETMVFGVFRSCRREKT